MSQPPNFSNQDSEERLSQAEVIEQLQKTIAQLNDIVSKLSIESVENLPSKLAVDSWVVITERLIESLEPSPVLLEEPTIIETPFTEVEPEPSKPEIPVTVIPEPPATVTPPPPVVKKVDIPKPPPRVTPEKPSSSRLQTLWNGVLDTIRALLPTSINEKLSDWLLTGIVSGILVLLLLSSVSLLTSSPKTEISQLPKINIEDLPVEAPVEVTTPEPTLEPIKTEKAPEREPKEPYTETIEPKPSFPTAIATPDELTAPEPPKPLAIEPPAPIILTPEQNLIASIQAEIKSLTKQFPEGIVTSLQANFVDSLLIIIVDEDWYSLSKAKQLELANSVWKRSQKLDFQKIEIQDTDKEVVARSPVVGDNVIIIKSTLDQTDLT